jgi:hypothetical protein
MRRARPCRPGGGTGRTARARNRGRSHPAPGLGADVDRARRHLAGGAGHAPVGDQRDLLAAVLQHAERRGQLVQLGHAVGARALEAHHGDEVALELAGLEGGEQRVLVCRTRAGASMRRCSGDRRGLDHRAAEVARAGRRPPSARTARPRGAARRSSRLAGGVAPFELARRRAQGSCAARAGRGRDGSGCPRAAGRRRAVRGSGRPCRRRRGSGSRRPAVRIDARQQRHRRGEFVQVVPVDAGCRRRARSRPGGSRGWSSRRWPAGRPCALTIGLLVDDLWPIGGR